MKFNFVWGKVVGYSGSEEQIESKIKEHLSVPSFFAIPEDGIVNVSIFSDDPPFFTIMGAISNSANDILLRFSFPDGESIKITPA